MPATSGRSRAQSPLIFARGLGVEVRQLTGMILFRDWMEDFDGQLWLLSVFLAAFSENGHEALLGRGAQGRGQTELPGIRYSISE